MIGQKKRYSLSLLTITLLVGSSTGFASENEPLGGSQKGPSWWTRAENYLSDAAKYSLEGVKSSAPYAPAAGAALLIPKLAQTELQAAAGLGIATALAALGRDHTKASQTPEQRSSSWRNWTPYLIPSAAVGSYALAQGAGKNALTGLGIGAALAAPAWGISKYRSYSNLNSFKQIRDGITEKVNAVLDTNDQNIFLDKSILALIMKYDEYYKYVQDDLPLHEQIPDSFNFIRQVAIDYTYNNDNKKIEDIIKQISPIKIQQQDVDFYLQAHPTR